MLLFKLSVITIHELCEPSLKRFTFICDLSIAKRPCTKVYHIRIQILWFLSRLFLRLFLAVGDAGDARHHHGPFWVCSPKVNAGKSRRLGHRSIQAALQVVWSFEAGIDGHFAASVRLQVHVEPILGEDIGAIGGSTSLRSRPLKRQLHHIFLSLHQKNSQKIIQNRAPSAYIVLVAMVVILGWKLQIMGIKQLEGCIGFGFLKPDCERWCLVLKPQPDKHTNVLNDLKLG